MEEFAAALVSMAPDQRQRCYARLWFELTIGARGIWSGHSLSDAQKLDGLKWMNEIQHRVWQAYMDSPGYSPPQLIERVAAHVQQAEHIRGEVLDCFRRAIARRAGA